MKNKLIFLLLVLVLFYSTGKSVSKDPIAFSQAPISHSIYLPVVSKLPEIIPADRRIDWSYAGIPGGIPHRNQICKTIKSAVYGNGSTDATAAIQAALEKCPEGQVVYLQAGVYLISGSIWMNDFDTLRGAGPGLTILKHTGSYAGSIVTMTGLFSLEKTFVVVAANKDSQVITLADTKGITPGDLLLINQLNDGKVVDSLGTNGKCKFCGVGNGDRALGQLVEVTAVAGSQVSINVPLHWTYDPALNPWAYKVDGEGIIRYAGLENLTLTQDTPIVTWMIEMQGAQYSWIKNVEIKNIKNGALYVIESLQNEFRGNYIHTAIAGYGSSYGYGITLGYNSSNNLVENNILDDLDGGGVETHAGASGNVLSFNYLHDIKIGDPKWMTISPSLNHGAHPKMNLWEGNIGYKVGTDFIWGSSSHNTVFRSQSKGWVNETTTFANNAVEFGKKSYYMNVVGSVLGTPVKSNRYEVLPGQPYVQYRDNAIWVLGADVGGSPIDPNVAATLFRHGNFDYVTNSVVWDPNIIEHNLPDSLYLGQVPDWWCQETPWPAIGPDVAGWVNKIPAERRFEEAACLQKDALTLSGTPGNESMSLRWKVNGTFSFPTTLRIDYSAFPYGSTSSITSIPSTTRSLTLTGLNNYTLYKVTLTTDPPWLSNTIFVMPTDHFFFPAVN